jgi:hypothetical protein
VNKKFAPIVVEMIQDVMDFDPTVVGPQNQATVSVTENYTNESVMIFQFWVL